MNERFRTLFRKKAAEEISRPIGPRPEITTFRRPVVEYDLPQGVEANLNRPENRYQREMLEFCVDAARSVARLYNAQVGKGTRANFYPTGIRREVVRKAAEANPDILNPYTNVIRDPSGRLTTEPMHISNKDLISRLNIRESLSKAAEAARRFGDIDSSRYLRLKADSFINGDYKSSERLWLTRADEPAVDIVIGPYDTYTDKFMGIKYSYQSWVGVLDRELTQNSQWFLNAFIDWRKFDSGQTSPKVKMRIDNTRIMSGQAAMYDWTGNSLPCQQEWRQQMGSKFTIFKPVFEDKFALRRLPAYKSVISPRNRVVVPDRLVRTANLRRYIAHETSHSFVPDGVERRLQNYASTTKELYCELLALKGYGAIPVAGINLSDQEKSVALGTVLANGVLEYQDYTSEKKRLEYYVASSILLKFCLDKGNVKIENGKITWNNHPQVYNDISELFTDTHNLLLLGSRKDAKDFFEKNFDPDVYKPLTPNHNEPSPFDIRPKINPNFISVGANDPNIPQAS